MREYMRKHADKMRERLQEAEKHHRWAECMRLEVRIQEADNLYIEMLLRVKNGTILWEK